MDAALTKTIGDSVCFPFIASFWPIAIFNALRFGDFMTCYYNRLSNEFFGDSQYLDCLLQVMWHITTECRLNCKMCFSKVQNEGVGSVSQKQIRSTIELLHKLGVQKVDLSGGEPLLFPLLEYAVNECVHHEILPTITTSGYGEKSIINWAVSNSHLFSRIILSLDGPSSIHNFLRDNSEAFSHFVKLYNKLVSVGCDRIRINTVVSNVLIHNKEEYCNVINSLKPCEVCCIQPHPINKTNFFDEFAPSEDDYFGFVEYVKRHIASEIRVLQRSRNDYASYWTLYPNNILCLLSEENRYQHKFMLLPENIPEIIETVRSNPQTYIKLNCET